MKLQAKVIAGFCAVAVLTLAVAIIGYWEARNLASALYEVGAVRLPSIQGLAAIGEAMRTVQATERALLLPGIDDAAFDQQLMLERRAWESADAGFALYEPLPQTTDESVEWNAFRTAWQAWKQDHDRLVVLIRTSRNKGDKGGIAAAQARSLAESAALFDRASTRLENVSRINGRIAADAKQRSVASQADLERTERLMLLTAFFGVLGAMALGLYMARRFTRPIVEIAGAMSRVAVGDRSTTVPVRSSDEIGEMASAMNAMVAALSASEADRSRVEDELRQSQKMEAIGQLAGGVAHDFNNLLTVILGKAAMLVQDARLAPALREAATDIYASGERAANLTGQLLAFSRRQAILKRDLDLNVVVASLARMLRRVLGEDVDAQFIYGLSPACVHADAGMIDQVLLNLAINARDAMPHGGTLTIETAVVAVDAEHAARHVRARMGSFASISVRDTGTGIAPEHLFQIFEPFFTTKDVGKGTGLGLATSYGIVMQHDGWIEVESQVGHGATFRVLLPLVERIPDQPIDIPAALDVSPVAGSETILVVEDEEDVRALCVELLRSLGYRVLEAASGPRAIDVWTAQTARIQLLITDMVMPEGMTGLELSRVLRRINPALRVIYTSGYLADKANLTLLQGDGDEYLPKPFSLPDLSRAVRRALDAGGPPTA